MPSQLLGIGVCSVGVSSSWGGRDATYDLVFPAATENESIPGATTLCGISIKGAASGMFVYTTRGTLPQDFCRSRTSTFAPSCRSWAGRSWPRPGRHAPFIISKCFKDRFGCSRPTVTAASMGPFTVRDATGLRVQHTWCIRGHDSSGVLLTAANEVAGVGGGVERVRRRQSSTWRPRALFGRRGRRSLAARVCRRRASRGQRGRARRGWLVP